MVSMSIIPNENILKPEEKWCWSIAFFSYKYGTEITQFLWNIFLWFRENWCFVLFMWKWSEYKECFFYFRPIFYCAHFCTSKGQYLETVLSFLNTTLYFYIESFTQEIFSFEIISYYLFPDIRFQHLFIRSYQERETGFGMGWTLIDDLVTSPKVGARSRIECSLICRESPDCTGMIFKLGLCYMESDKWK